MYGTEQERHEMQLEKVYQSGVEEWHCPVCGRRFLMQWPPEYKKIVLEPGDESAFHSGGKGGSTITISHVQQEEEQRMQEELIAVEEERLRPWIEWMESVNFEKLWE